MKVCNYFFKIFFIIFFPFTVFSQGFTKNKSNYDTNNKSFPLTRSILPSAFSLEKFTHTPINQGNYSMCSSYSLASIQSITFFKRNNISDINQIDNNLFSPTFLYFLFKNNDDLFCSNGMDAQYSINQLIEYELGIPKKRYVEENKFSSICDYYPYTESDLKHDLIEGSKFIFDDLYIHTIKLKNGMYKAKHKEIKQQLLNGNPSLLSIPTDSNFHYQQSSNFCKKINSNLEPTHAVVIIGFDDLKFGGSYRILNSWGEDWEDNGKAWIKYVDLDAFLGDIMSVELVEVKDIVLDDKYWSNIISVFDRDFKFMNDTLIKK